MGTTEVFWTTGKVKRTIKSDVTILTIIIKASRKRVETVQLAQTSLCNRRKKIRRVFVKLFF